MPSFFTTAAAATALLSLASAQTYGDNSGISNVSTSACPTGKGIHVIAARASLEAPGYGVIGYVKDQVLARIPGSTAEAVVYPATLNDYLNSETAGVIAMRKLITEFAAKCPSSLLVAMGYSQGAQVSADSLVGQNDNGFPDNSSADSPLPSSILARTAAVILMGDPTALVNQTFHVGNATKNSDFPRHDDGNFQITGLGSRVQSYCDAGDPYCAAGGDLAVHLGYVQEYGAQAVDFVVAQVAKLQGNSTISNGTSTNGTSTNGTASPSGALPSGRVNSTATATGTGSIKTTTTPTSTGAAKTSAAAPSTSSPASYKGVAAVSGMPYVLGTVAGLLMVGLLAMPL